MKLCIAEKRDVAKKLAKYIGATQDNKDWFEGSGYCVTWCKGHLLELYVPESEGRWTLSNLPILPRQFELAPISIGKDKEGKRIEDPDSKHRLYIIRQLIGRCDELINCCDAAREGQLIFENVYRYTGIRRPCKRLWISSLVKKDILDGFRDLHDNDEFKYLGIAARVRSEGDWLVGINATRAFTLTANSPKVLSLGRVQTPTLCMICSRYLENKNFKSEPFWYIAGEAIKDAIPFKYRCDERYYDEARAKEKYEAVLAEGQLTVDSVITERKNEDAPLLHDLASLQKLANSKYGMTAKQTLDAAQALYEKQLISYPRTSSRYISENIFKEVPDILRALSDHPTYGEFMTRLVGGPLNRRSVEETKITDHHGLIVTGIKPEGLSVSEAQIYELVLIRFVEAFSPVCVVDLTTVELTAAEVTFIVKGRRELYLGWRAISRGENFEDVEPEEIDQEEMNTNPLPPMAEGETIPLGRFEIVRDATKPKPLLTEATLLTQMENAGKKLEDKKMAKALKGVGIGTPATRDSVIEELVHRTYIYREKKKLVPTELGLNVYDKIKDKEIADVQMTAKWESSLNEIAEGNEDILAEFETGIRDYTMEITDNIRLADDIRSLAASVQMQMLRCPKCGKKFPLGENGGRCECGFAAWRKISGKRLSDTQMKQLYEEGRTETLSGFKSKDGKSFSAALYLERDKLSFRFPDKAEEEGLTCPKCGAKMRFSKKSCWCGECNFIIWREKSGKVLTDAQITSLLKTGKTSKLSGFVSKAGKPFEAALILDGDGKVQFDFPKK